MYDNILFSSKRVVFDIKLKVLLYGAF